MKAQENAKNDDISIQSDTLSDLAVTDEQADETKGGTTAGYNTWRQNFGRTS